LIALAAASSPVAERVKKTSAYPFGVGFGTPTFAITSSAQPCMPAAPAGAELASTADLMRSGTVSSISWAMKLPMEKPSRSKLSRPRADTKATAPVAIAATLLGVRPVDAATPTLSKAITLRLVASPSISAGSQLSSEPRKCCRSTSGIESSLPTSR